MLVHVDKTSHIIMACCVLHNFCELHGILEPILCDIKDGSDQSIGFLTRGIVLEKENKQKQWVNY
jgi:hypothetical protein